MLFQSLAETAFRHPLKSAVEGSQKETTQKESTHIAKLNTVLVSSLQLGRHFRQPKVGDKKTLRGFEPLLCWPKICL